MRLQLIRAMAIALTATTATAEPAAPGGAATLRVYADDDHVTVVSPTLSATAPTGPADLQLRVDLEVDAVTAASVDVVTSASPATVHELRVEAALTASHEVGPRGGRVLALGARASHERDYDALRASAAARTEVAGRSTTLELRYQAGLDDARATGRPAFHARRTQHQVTALLGQLLGPRTVLDVIAEATWARGYHASPYRRVPIEGLPGGSSGGAPGPLPAWVDEATPATRASAALAVRLRRAVGRRWGTSATYRGYVDGWGLASHTVTAEAIHAPTPRWRLGVLARGYVQGGAAFYAERYAGDAAGAPVHRTRDRTLGPMRTAFASVTVDRTLGEPAPGAAGWHLVVAIGALAMWTPAFAPQRARHALITTLGVTVAW